MKNKIIYLIIILIAIILGCKRYNKISQSQDDSKAKMLIFNKIAREKFSGDTIIKFSSDNHYVLCQKKRDENNVNPNNLLEYFIFDLNINEIVFEEIIANASISWKNNYQIIITRQLGIITSADDSGKSVYIYDLKAKKRIEIDESIIEEN